MKKISLMLYMLLIVFFPLAQAADLQEKSGAEFSNALENREKVPGNGGHVKKGWDQHKHHHNHHHGNKHHHGNHDHHSGEGNND